MELGKINPLHRMRLVIIFLFICFVSTAQGEKKQTQERPGLFWYFSGLRPFKDTDRKKYDRVIVDLTYNDWIGENGPFNNNWNSIGVAASLNKDILLERSENITLGIGLGYGYLNHRTPRLFYVTPFESVQSQVPASTDSIISSFFTVHQFYIPLELRFRSKGWKHKKIILGARLGIQPFMNISSYRTFEGQVEYSEVKLKEEYNWFYFSTYIRCGFRNWSLFCAYQPLSIFSNNQSMEIHPLQMGVSLSLF